MSRKRGNFNLSDSFEYWSPGWLGVLGLLFWLLVGVLLGNGVTLMLTNWLGSEIVLNYGILLSYVVMFIPPMIFASYKSRKKELTEIGARSSKLDRNNFAPLGWVLCLLLVAVATFASGVVSDLINSIMPPMPEYLKETLENMTDGVLWVNFLSVCIFAPVFEEWLCRGMVLRGLLDHKVKPVWAILASAVFFGLIHGNIWQMVPAILVGALMGYVYYKTRSLKLTMLMHFTNNGIALLTSHIDAFKDADTWMDVLGNMYWPMFAACVIILALFFLAFKKIQPSKSF